MKSSWLKWFKKKKTLMILVKAFKNNYTLLYANLEIMNVSEEND